MAFYPIDYLEQGKVEFLDRLTEDDIKEIIFTVRYSERRNSIIDGFLPILKETNPYFCYEIIYDIEEYKEVARELMQKYKIRPDMKHLTSMLENSSLGLDYLHENFDDILLEYVNDPDFIFDYIFDNLEICKNLVNKLRVYPNLHIRFLFMSYLIQNRIGTFNILYPEITPYLSGMDSKDVSLIAYDLFMAKKMKLFHQVKEYILKNYPTNNLAELLLCGVFNPYTFQLRQNKRGIREFKTDADRYFETAATWRYNITKNYSRNVSKELLEGFKKYLLMFQHDGRVDKLFEHLDIHGLTRLLQEYVDKYLELSHDKSYEYLTAGSTASCYRIGDYVFKLVRTKWSYEDVICPNLYLILPNLEEHFIRNRIGIVEAGIEVQRFLRRDAKKVPSEIFAQFRETLKGLGYFSTDTLINGECGDNTRLLDSYEEAGVEVPDWFREYPLVLVDRDRIYKLGTTPRQQSSNIY